MSFVPNNVGLVMIGEDISVCVCLAILISLFNEEGNVINLKYINLKHTEVFWCIMFVITQELLMVGDLLKKRV